jgi:hypothetical protein
VIDIGRRAGEDEEEESRGQGAIVQADDGTARIPFMMTREMRRWVWCLDALP